MLVQPFDSRRLTDRDYHGTPISRFHVISPVITVGSLTTPGHRFTGGDELLHWSPVGIRNLVEVAEVCGVGGAFRHAYMVGCPASYSKGQRPVFGNDQYRNAFVSCDHVEHQQSVLDAAYAASKGKGQAADSPAHRRLPEPAFSRRQCVLITRHQSPPVRLGHSLKVGSERSSHT